MKECLSGTLAIDLGNTNTVLAFQDQKDINYVLVEIPNVTSYPGVVPTAVWFEEPSKIPKIGISALKMKDNSNSELFFHSNFKRLIGNSIEKITQKNILNPNECGEKFFQILWASIPHKYEIKRLVLTAPIDTYKGYRKWLVNLCEAISVDEIALVDEPTAASLGINVPFGSKIMTIDIGGSTVDMNIVKIEGGEGKSGPIAELLKFKGNDVSSISKQKIRCAEIIGKTGSKIGGKDIDQWIVDYFIPGSNDVTNLLNAEAIKCKLSSSAIKYENKYSIKLFIKSILSLNDLLSLFISKTSKIFDFLTGITFLLPKLKISTAVRIVQLVLISLNSELIKLFLLESYSTSIIPPSIGYNEEFI